MPTYEYVCEKCGHEFEAFHSISAVLDTCSKDTCGRKKWGKGQVKKKISAGGGLLFKGSGFYITDYRSEGYKQSARKDSTASSAKPESKSESKPDTSKPAKK